MPRPLPRYDQKLANSIAFAMDYTIRIEHARVAGAVGGASRVTIGDLEFSYELAFLRIFLAWEVLLENALLRFISGYRHSGGLEPLKAGLVYYPSLAMAERALLGGRRFQLWHDPAQVMVRARRFLIGSRYELILASAQGRVEQLACVRHRIAHSQRDAQVRFDAVTMALAARRYRGSRPGRFLRDRTMMGGQSVRWISVISSDLESLAHQICS
jgi:hypothetical protein